MAKIDWDKDRRRRMSRTTNPPPPARHRGVISQKQQRYMRHLAAKYGRTFTEHDTCCAMHASQWIEHTKRRL